MLDRKNFIVILNYYNEYLWDRKIDENGWNYYGLILDYYFLNSVLSVDYLSLEDFFLSNGELSISETTCLVEQYEDVSEEQRLYVIQNILNILKFSTMNVEKNIKTITATINSLKRKNIKVEDLPNSEIKLKYDDFFDSGSYCNIIKVKEGILRKELKTIYKNDEQQIKRIKYEYENMRKLVDCPQILNVFDYNEEENYYLMEQADTNLVDYLKDNISLSFNDIIKIIMDILKGMEAAHNNSIIHRDLHLGNVLKIGNDFVISDFGLSKDLSIERSMKSSCTAKNNHIFVDPVGLVDFTKLDSKSDIYSIGKIIDYIFTNNYTGNYSQLKIVIDKCINREKGHRYNHPLEIINDIEYILKTTKDEESTKIIVNNIENNVFNTQVQQFILGLAEEGTISQFIVNYKLSLSGLLFSKFNNIYQEQIISSILEHYVDATGFNGWSNYDVFARVAYDLYCNSKDLKVKKISKQLLEECSKMRYRAKELFDRLPIT